MDDFAAASDGFDHLFAVFLVEILDALVGGDYEGVMIKRNTGTFHFSVTRVMIHPDLEVVTKARVVMVVEEHCLLAGVAVPPLVLGLDVDV